MSANRTTVGRVIVAGRYVRERIQKTPLPACKMPLPYRFGEVPDTEIKPEPKKPKNLRVLAYITKHGKITLGKMKFMGVKNTRSCIQSLRNRGHVIRFKDKEYHYEGTDSSV